MGYLPSARKQWSANLLAVPRVMDPIPWCGPVDRVYKWDRNQDGGSIGLSLYNLLLCQLGSTPTTLVEGQTSRNRRC